MKIVRFNPTSCTLSEIHPGELLFMSEIEQINVSENSTQKLTQDLSLKQISQVLIQNWPLFLILLCSFCLLSLAAFTYKVPYVSTGTVIVNDAQNSSLQSFAQQFAGKTSVKLNEAKKSNSPLQKYLEYLKTTDFYSKLIFAIEAKKTDNQLSIAEKIGYKQFTEKVLANKKFADLGQDDQIIVYKSLESLLSYKIVSDYELEISTSSKTKELSLFLTNSALSVVSTELKNKESSELVKIQNFLNEQKKSIDLELQVLNQKMTDFQNKPENLISLSSKEKIGEYISELMMRKNEVRMKIAENSKMIGYLKAASGQNRENQLYGNAGQVQSLQIENEMLRSKLQDIQASVDRVTQQAKVLPAAGLAYEDIKKKSEVEFAKYKDVSEALSKTEAYQLSLTNKFEILEKSRYEKVKPLVSLLTLLLVSLVLSQVFGSLIIYVTTIWDSSLVTAQSTRNVVVIDSHSLDPRVIIENSKIKFRLRDSEFSHSRRSMSFDQKDKSETEDSQKISFDVMKKFHGDDQKSEG
jgi:hypothetical protein